MKRVVVTGMGVVSPLGNSTQTFWKNLIASKSAIRPFPSTQQPLNKHKWNDKIPCKVAASVDITDFESNHLLPFLQSSTCHKDIIQSRLTPFIQYAIVAANEALNDANWNPSLLSVKDQYETGVAIGSCLNDVGEITAVHDLLNENNFRRVNPLFVPKILLNMASGYVSIQYQAKGPNVCVSTACATGAHAIADAYRYIQSGDARVMIAGGTEACLNAVAFSGFSRLRALCTSFDNEEASRPFDVKRDGFVMGEGAGMLVIEDLEHALERGAKIYAELTGCGLAGEAYHITSPSPDGAAAQAVMRKAATGSIMPPEDSPQLSTVDYVNAHATSTKVGDRIEMEAILKTFGRNPNLRVSSIKGAVGHLLGASGAVEAISTVLSVYNDKIPVTKNLTQLDEDVQDRERADQVFMVGQESAVDHEVRRAISNSFGFGGANTALCFEKYLGK